MLRIYGYFFTQLCARNPAKVIEGQKKHIFPFSQWNKIIKEKNIRIKINIPL